MEKLRQKCYFFLLSVVLPGSCTSVANAWGAPGHRIVAVIAERHLKPQARQRIAAILGPDVSLASVANYADAIRNRRPETHNFHFVDIPLQANNYDPARDCQPDPDKGDCILPPLTGFAMTFGIRVPTPQSAVLL